MNPLKKNLALCADFFPLQTFNNCFDGLAGKLRETWVLHNGTV